VHVPSALADGAAAIVNKMMPTASNETADFLGDMSFYSFRAWSSDLSNPTDRGTPC